MTHKLTKQIIDGGQTKKNRFTDLRLNEEGSALLDMALPPVTSVGYFLLPKDVLR